MQLEIKLKYVLNKENEEKNLCFICAVKEAHYQMDENDSIRLEECNYEFEKCDICDSYIN